jgi:phosphoglycolate phosphatase-like HAD superfamily hydrolase
MTILQALIFDVDGPLIDTEELHRQALLEYDFDRAWGPARCAELRSDPTHRLPAGSRA